MNIRPFDASERDCQAILAIKWVVWPEYRHTLEEFRAFDAAWDRKHFLHRLIAEVDGQVVGFASCYQAFWVERPGTYGVWIDVLPGWRRRGIGGALYAAALDALAPHRPRTLITETREDQHGAVQFLRRHDFRRVMRHPESWLTVQTFDPTPFTRALEQVQAAGIDICDLPALQARDPDWQRKWWALTVLLLRDVPAPEPRTPPSFEQFSQQMSMPGFLPEGCWFALAGADYVGLTNMNAFPSDPELLETGLTGVLRSHRRLGIATALKVRAIEFARRRGARRLMTRNEENNPMYDLNRSLGFRPGPAMSEYEKDLGPPDASRDG
ncbi:GNAT family N-acetyltransferase [Nannocystis pusilla]|uniref:GNAT family N-acetyltransferase n=1 Tax=Nannocystis pusilla TaxID=889268 RepID=UPI003DA426E2